MTADDDSADAVLTDEELTPPVAPAARRRQPLSVPPPSELATGAPASPRPPRARAGTAPERSDPRLPSHPSVPDETGDESRPSIRTSPVAALHEDEFGRMQLFLRLVLGATAASALLVSLSSGDAFAKLVVYAGCLAVAGSAGFLVWRFRSPADYTPRRLAVAAFVIVLGAWGGIYYWGLASPAAAIYIYGIYVFALGANFRLILAMYLVSAIAHGVFAAAVLVGWVSDRGIVSLHTLTVGQQLAVVGMVQGLIFLAFVTARASRRRTLEAIVRLEKAVRGVAQREAMLLEVRQELDRALKIGGPGRYSEQVVGSFRLGMLIGRGGMGEVYEAVSVRDGSIAAVKLLHPATLSDPHHVQRFVREAEVAAKISSPAVVSVLEVGTTAGEVPFIAMERLHGQDLSFHLRRRRTLALGQLVELAEQVATGLEAARAAGIVHRDLKPHNLFLAEEPAADGTATRQRWKILDFGVSKFEHQQGTLTQGHVVGTPAYMAPEQARGEQVDFRADVYALAAICYRALTGHPVFTGKDVPSMLHDVVYRVPTQPSALAFVPADVERVLAIGLAKQLSDRFASASDFARALAAACSGELALTVRQQAEVLLAKHPWGSRL